MVRLSVMSAAQRSTRTSIRSTHLVPVRVTPRGGRDALSGWQDGVLRVRLAAAPVDGQANESLVRFLAKTAGLPARSVRVAGGDHSRMKRVAFEDIEPMVLRERLGIPADVPLG
jgi:uncharacterized protein YggU (UPF0235/DUF167 family)